jgi:DNA-binding NtrC family response regulator
VPLLAEHFLTLHARKMGMPIPRLTPEALQALVSSDFPGNIRDLENVIVRGLVMSESEGVVTMTDLQALTVLDGAPTAAGEVTPTNGAPGPMLDEAGGLLDTVARFEREQIERAIAAAGGNRVRAARALKISYRWLMKKLERYGTAPAGSGT